MRTTPTLEAAAFSTARAGSPRLGQAAAESVRLGSAALVRALRLLEDTA